MKKLLVFSTIILALSSCGGSGSKPSGIENIDYSYIILNQKIHQGWNTYTRTIYVNPVDGSVLPIENVLSGTPFVDGYALAWTRDPETKALSLNYYDKQGRKLENQFTTNMAYATVFNEDRAWVAPKGQYLKLIDKKGKEYPIDDFFFEVYPFYCGVSVVWDEYDCMYIVDRNGKRICDLGSNYMPVYPVFINDVLLVRGEKGFGAIDKTGKEVIPCKWNGFIARYEKQDDIDTFLRTAEWLDNGYIKVEGSNGFGVVDLKGNVVVEPEYRDAEMDGDWFCLTFRDDHFDDYYVWTDTKGEKVLGPFPAICDNFNDGPIKPQFDFSNGRLTGKHEYAFINRKGKLIGEYEYEFAEKFNPASGYAIAHKDKTYYLVDKNGTATEFGPSGGYYLLNVVKAPGRFLVKAGENSTIVDEKGKTLLEPGDYLIGTINTVLSRPSLGESGHRVGIISAALSDVEFGGSGDYDFD